MINPEWQLSVVGSLALFTAVGVFGRALIARMDRRRHRRGVPHR